MRRMAFLGAAVTALLALTGPPSAFAQTHRAPEAHSLEVLNPNSNQPKLRGSVTFHELSGEWWFTYCRVAECPPLADEESSPQVTSTPRQMENLAEAGRDVHAPIAVEWPIAQLQPGTDYRVTLHVNNDSHHHMPTALSRVISTPRPTVPATPVAPAASTGAAAGITPTTATLSGSAVPGTAGGAGVSSVAFFEYGTAAPGTSTPQRTLAADANAFGITESLTGLTPGTRYQYRLVVVRNGARTVGPTRTFDTPAVPACVAGTTYETVQIRRVRAIGCFSTQGTRKIASSPVRLNGVLLQKAEGHTQSGNRLSLDTAAKTLTTTAPWTMSTEYLEHMHTGRLDLAGLDSTSGPLMRLGADRSVELFDFPLAGELSFTPSADGSSRLGLLVSVPVPGMDSITGDVAVKVNPGGDLAFDRLRLEIGSMPVPGFELGNLRFVYDRSENQWEGGAEVALPTAARVRVAVGVTVKNGKFNAFQGSVDGLNQHLAYGVYLQRIGVRVGVEPWHLGGTLGITAGPKVGGVGIIGLQGDFDIDGPGGQGYALIGGRRTAVAYPGSLTLTATGTIFDIPLRTATAKLYFSHTPWIEAWTSLGLNIKSGDLTVLKVDGTIEGSLYGTDFELSGSMGATIFGSSIAQAIVLAGTHGIGACGQAGPFEMGAYKRWQGEFAQTWWCNMEDLRAAVAGHAAAASAASAGERLPIETRGEDQLVRFAGDARVRLHGPSGQTLDTPVAGQGTTKAAGLLAVRNDEAGYTDVILDSPGGAWTYEVLSGTVRGVKTAGELPEAKIAASVKGGKLSWTVGNLAGRRVTFMESGPGAPTRVLAKGVTRSGAKAFKPYLVPQRKRQIVAVVSYDGKVVARDVVATYTAPAVGRVTRVSGLKVHGRAASWKAMSGAMKFRVVIAQRSGRKALKTVTKPRVALPAGTSRVTVAAVGWDGRASKPVSVRVK